MFGGAVSLLKTGQQPNILVSFPFCHSYKILLCQLEVYLLSSVLLCNVCSIHFLSFRMTDCLIYCSEKK